MRLSLRLSSSSGGNGTDAIKKKSEPITQLKDRTRPDSQPLLTD